MTENEIKTRKLIILDDEEMMLRSLKRRFKIEQPQYELNCYSSPIAALTKLDEGECYAFITDVQMPDMSGDKVVDYIRRGHPNQDCIVITGHAERNSIQRIVQAGNVRSILLKPLDFDKLIEALNALSPSTENGTESGNIKKGAD